MSRFIALLNASDPNLLADIETAGGQVVSVSEPGFVVVDGDQSVADAVSQLQAVQTVGPVDSTWDTSELSLGDDVGTLVTAWNTSLGSDYQAALSNPYRDGEQWDFPGGCDPGSLGEDGGPLVADNTDGTGTGDGTTPTTGDGTGTDTGVVNPDDGTSGQVATNDPPPDSGGGSSGDTGGFGDTGGTGDGTGGGEPA